MSKPNVTLAAFCANLAYLNIEDKVNIILDLPNDYDEFDGRYQTLKDGANGRNLAIYGHWYVECIDLDGHRFDLTICEKAPY